METMKWWCGAWLGLALVAAGCSDAGDDGGSGGSGGSNLGQPLYTFGVIGDYGDTVDLMDGETNTLLVADLIKSWDPAFIATVGDNDYSDAAFEGTFDGLELGVGQYFHEYIGDYMGDRGPGSDENRFFPIPGDHDYGDDCDNPRLDDYLAYFTLPVGETDETYYDFRRGPVHFFALDSIEACHRPASKLDAERVWLERTTAASDAPFKVVLVHNPPYSSGERHGSAAQVQWPFQDWGIDLVISGDDHVYERIDRDGVVYLVAGIGGVDLHGFASPVDGSVVRYVDKYGALRGDVFENGLQLTMLSVDGDEIDRFAIGSPGGPAGDWYQPGIATTWQWQLQPSSGGAGINTSYDVDLYDIDLFDNAASVIARLQSEGRRVICYFSAGSYEAFRDDAGCFQESDLGNPLGDFPDERWVDIRSDNVRQIMADRLDLAVSKGCDGVEPDNVDGYTNDPGFGSTARGDLTSADQLDYNRWIASEAHNRGLAVGLKNDLDQIPDLVGDFDFSVNEQCHEFDECDLLSPFVDAGKAVFVAEYLDGYVNDAGVRDAMCADSRARNLRALVLSIDLDDSLRFSCDP